MSYMKRAISLINPETSSQSLSLASIFTSFVGYGVWIVDGAVATYIGCVAAFLWVLAAFEIHSSK